MRREPSLTFRGALEILGHHDRPAIEKLDKILGGVILASGVAAGVAALAGLPLPPVGLWAALWGWTEQKDAAVSLLRKALDSATGKLNGTSGYERRELIAAAHTTIVVAAFFEVLREEADEQFNDMFNITDAQKEKLLAGRLYQDGSQLFNTLYVAEVPSPSPLLGFEENIVEVLQWMVSFSQKVREFIKGLWVGVEYGRVDWSAIASRATERYRSFFLELAAKVPEFAIWLMLVEDAATRTLIQQQNTGLAMALARNESALARVETLLALTAGQSKVVADLRVKVDRANQRILDQPIIPTDAGRHGPDLKFPSVSHLYINPRFRVAEFDPKLPIADEHWWGDVPSRDEFDLTLAAYITTSDATRLPMLLLGDPGAGKSLLTQVLAARLGGAGYTVVRVPLRRVGANAPIGHQIQQALNDATTERVKWTDLSDQSVGTTRVVLLDGLDELLQASSSDRSGYLQEVTDFQDAEAAQERPLVVIVTSRIMVVDRVDIPQGTTVVKLDTFTYDDISDWLRRWEDANSVAIADRRVRALTFDAALLQPELARQPLLLLMLAIYAADPTSPPLDADMSTADLYRSILEEFGRREARKTVGDHARGRELDERVQDHLDRLAIAALAMFNRGRQDISEDELGRDLKALDERLMGRARPDEAGQRVIGEFFFVHAPEARMTAHDENSRRSYEFLHATFGEYLVARRVMDELLEVAAKAFVGRRGPSDPQDDLLFALLSHQPLAARSSTLIFAEQIAAALSDLERTQLLDTLEMLLDMYRDRHGSDHYANYRPAPTDTIRRLACYSANLVSLRVMLEPSNAGVPVATLVRVADGDGLLEWRSMVMLWQSGLDASGMQAVLSTLVLTPDVLAVRIVDGEWLGEETSRIARLLGDRDLEWRIRYGAAIWDHRGDGIVSDSRDWVHGASSMLIPLAIGGELIPDLFPDPPENVSINDYRRVADLIFDYLRDFGPGSDLLEFFIAKLFEYPSEFTFDGYALARAAIIEPDLLGKFPQLRDSKVYGSFYTLIEALGSEELKTQINRGRRRRKEFDVKAMRDLLARVMRVPGAHPWSIGADGQEDAGDFGHSPDLSA